MRHLSEQIAAATQQELATNQRSLSHLNVARFKFRHAVQVATLILTVIAADSECLPSLQQSERHVRRQHQPVSIDIPLATAHDVLAPLTLCLAGYLNAACLCLDIVGYKRSHRNATHAQYESVAVHGLLLWWSAQCSRTRKMERPLADVSACHRNLARINVCVALDVDARIVSVLAP